MDGCEDFVLYGKALEPLDEDSIPRKKPFSLEDQVVRDEKGRRRFHGAFTGGFSAGYWNTVGSFEGWQPSEFKSSKNERSTAVQKRPQDFMDREDLGEFGIAPNRVMTRDDYSYETRKRSAPEFYDDPIPGRPVLEDILKPVRETVGVRLLKQMGWRLGQGVGPRVTANEKRRIYGCSLPPGSTAEEESDSDNEVIPEDLTFAPDDVQTYVVTPKQDNFGLGYSGLDRRSVFGVKKISGGLKMTTNDNRKVDIRGQAFGVGAFEEEDEDVYSREDISNFDFELTDEATTVSKAHYTMPGIIEGFEKAKNKVIKKIYPPPPLPKNFKPLHKGLKVSRWEPTTTNEPISLKSQLNVETRAAVLGEPSIKAKDINEIESKKRKEETLQMISGTKGIPSSFKPFAADPDKQKRYEQYQQLVSIGAANRLKDLQPVTMSTWEGDRETAEFEQATRIFRPLTGVMDDRFTQAAQADDVNNPLAVVEKLKHGTDDQRNAAKLKMFGRLTRTTHDWEPCSLLCKRFNVPEPNSIFEEKNQKRKKTKYSIFDNLEALTENSDWNSSSNPTTAELPAISQSSISNDLIIDLDVIPLPEEKKSDPNTQLETPLFTDPASKIDLFKAIFLDSSDDEKEEEVNITEPPKKLATLVTYDEEITNECRNTSPPRGLFENIDLDALAKPVENKIEPKRKPESPPKPLSPQPEASQSTSADFYGPKLPDNLIKTNIPVPVNSEEDLGIWLERKVHKSKKNKKEKIKHKHKSKKKKKKNK